MRCPMANRDYIWEHEIAEVTDCFMEGWKVADDHGNQSLAHKILEAGFELVKFWEEMGCELSPLTIEHDRLRRKLAKQLNRWIHEAQNIYGLDEEDLKSVSV
jgi:hypothetical protein